MEGQVPVKSFLYDVVLPKVEKIHLFVSVAGIILLCSHNKGGSKLCIVGLIGLACAHFLLAYKPIVLRDEVNFPEHYFGNGYNPSADALTSFDVVVSRVLYISSACTLVGILFKLLLWKGADNQLSVGLLLLAVSMIFWGLKQRINRRALVVAVLGTFMLFTSSESIASHLYCNQSQLVRNGDLPEESP